MDEKQIIVRNLKKYFKVKNGYLHAVDDLSFFINKGETLGLVGESGCGKSTTGRTLIRLLEADSGEVLYDGEDILKYDKEKMRIFRQKFQMVFQDPYSSLNPRLPISEIITEPIDVNNVYPDKKSRMKRLKDLMELVGIKERLINSYPHELDGGMRQRVGIARALSINPSFIILDEPVSALDVCIQAQILNLLRDLQETLDLTYLFISHDLSVVKFISKRIAVMYLGKIVELSNRNILFKDPLHPYTQALLSAIPRANLNANRERILLRGDVPSPVNPPNGCRFAGRCDYAQDICRQESPELKEVEPERFVACHFVRNLQKND